MKSFLFGLSVFSFVFWGIAFLFSIIFYDLPHLLSLQIKGQAVAYLHNIIETLLNTINYNFPLILISVVLLLLVVNLNLGNDIAFNQNKIAIALLFLIFIVHGVGINFLVLLKDSYLLRRGLPNGFIFLLIDTLILLIPSVLLLLSLLGYDFRKSFLISLLPVIIISYFLNFYYGLANFKVF